MTNMFIPHLNIQANGHALISPRQFADFEYNQNHSKLLEIYRAADHTRLLAMSTELQQTRCTRLKKSTTTYSLNGFLIASKQTSYRYTKKLHVPIIAVYAVKNELTNQVYIGSTANFLKRWNSHFRLLTRGVSKNRFLQENVNEYGIQNFTITILAEYTTTDDLISEEIAFGRRYPTELLLNCLLGFTPVNGYKSIDYHGTGRAKQHPVQHRRGPNTKGMWLKQ